jgi:anti-sigma factor RsiW
MQTGLIMTRDRMNGAMWQVITDFDIQALVDNELSWEDEKRVRAYIQSNPDAKRRYDELSAQQTALRSWWKQTEKAH